MRKVIAVISVALFAVGTVTGIGLADHKEVKAEFDIEEGEVSAIDPDDVINRHAVWMKWRDDRLNVQKDPFDNEEPRRAEGESEEDFDMELKGHNIRDTEKDRWEKVG